MLKNQTRVGPRFPLPSTSVETIWPTAEAIGIFFLQL